MPTVHPNHRSRQVTGDGRADTQRVADAAGCLSRRNLLLATRAARAIVCPRKRKRGETAANILINTPISFFGNAPNIEVAVYLFTNGRVPKPSEGHTIAHAARVASDRFLLDGHPAASATLYVSARPSPVT